MPVIGLHSVAIDVPSLADGVDFYTAAGLEVAIDGKRARFRCAGQSHDCLVLEERGERKRLNHVSLFARDLDDMAAAVDLSTGSVVTLPTRSSQSGLWVRDPHGVLFHLTEVAGGGSANARTTVNRSTLGGQKVGLRGSLPRSQQKPVLPLRLGHVALFSPDVPASIDFLTGALGMGLADRSEDAVAFCCVRQHSDHHVVALGKSNAIGLHHLSFEVDDADAVGRAGQALRDQTGRKGWGFGRHVVGSNFFEYVEDPWGSWIEFYSDMDHIADYRSWTPANYSPQDALASWGPPLPAGFDHNREVD